MTRTHDTQNQNLLPYRLATRQYKQEAIFFWLFWLAVKSIKNKILLKSLFKNGADSGARSHNKCLEGTYVTNYTIPAAVTYASRARSCLLSFATIAALCGPRALNKFILASIIFLFKSLFIFFFLPLFCIFIISKIFLKINLCFKWWESKGLNLDWESHNLSCYHYTTNPICHFFFLLWNGNIKP